MYLIVKAPLWGFFYFPSTQYLLYCIILSYKQYIRGWCLMKEKLKKISYLTLLFISLTFANAYADTGTDKSSIWNNSDKATERRLEETNKKIKELNDASERQKQSRKNTIQSLKVNIFIIVFLIVIALYRLYEKSKK